MKKKSRLEITVERHRRVVIRTRHPRSVAWCEGCASFATMLTPEEAAALMGTTARDIYRRVEAGDLHFHETEGGRVLVCATSL
jgi:excisionase family DNA binding protein